MGNPGGGVRRGEAVSCDYLGQARSRRTPRVVLIVCVEWNPFLEGFLASRALLSFTCPTKLARARTDIRQGGHSDLAIERWNRAVAR